MVNVVNDPRFQMARLMRQQSQAGAANKSIPMAPAPAVSEGAVQLGRAAVSFGNANPTLREQLDAIAGGTNKQQTPGALGAILGNPIAKAGLNALNVLAVPGRAVVSTGREIADAWDGNDKTKFSLTDWKNQVKDPTFGFGKAFKFTDNLWVNRVVGFVGDIATDPLTYVTFGGGKFAGYAGRLDLAQAVLKTTGDNALANSVQRFGRAAIKDKAILERVGANRHGLYMLGKRVKVGKMGQGWRIPGTGAIGMLGDSALSRLRVSAMATKRGQMLQRITLPAEGLAARQALLQGKVGDDAAAVIISHLTADAPSRMAAGTALVTQRNALAETLRSQEALGLEGYADNVYKYLEQPELLADAPRDVQESVAFWRAWLDEKEQTIESLVKEIDPEAPSSYRNNYFPMIHSEDARALINDPSNPNYGWLREIYDRDPLAGGGNFKTRTLRPGDEWFGVVLTEDDLKKGIERLNEIASRPGTGFTGKFFETDIRKVLPKYIEEYAKEIGVLTRHKHLVDGGFWKRADDVLLGENVVDKDLVSGIKAKVKSVHQELREATRTAGRSHAELIDAIMNQRKRAQEALDEFNARGGNLAAGEELASLSRAIDDALHDGLALTSDSFDSLSKIVGVTKAKLAEIFDAEIINGKVMYGADGMGSYVLDGLLGHMDDLERDLFRLRTEVYSLDQDITGKALAELSVKAEKEMGKALARVESAQKILERNLEFGNQLQTAIAKMIAGDGTGDTMTEVADILTMMGFSANQAATTVENAFMRSRGITGGMTETFRDWARRENGLFNRVSRHSKLESTRITDKSIHDFFNDLPRLITNDVSIDEARELGIFILYRDARIYNGRIPKPILKLREQLIAQLEMADAAANFSKTAASIEGAGGRATSKKIFETEWSRVISEVAKLEEDAIAIDDFLIRANSSGVNLDDVVDWDSLDYSAHPFLADYSPENFGDNFMMYDDLMRGTEFTNEPLSTESIGRIMRTASGDKENITYRELIERVKSHRTHIDNKMNDPEQGWSMNQGASQRNYSGKQVAAKHKEYYDLIKRRNEILDMRKQYRERALKQAESYRRDFDSLSRRKKEAALLPRTAREKFWTPEMERRLSEAKRGATLDTSVSTQQAPLPANIEKEYADISNRLKEIADSGSVDASELDGTVNNIQENLQNAIIQYTIISEVTARWNGVAEVMGAFGLTPTQSTFDQITKAVGSKFIPILESQRQTLMRTQGIFERLDATVAERIVAQRGTGKSAGQIFAEAVSEMSLADRNLIADVVGPSFRGGADPIELRAGLKTARSGLTGSEKTAAENEYLERVVRPWVMNAYPEIAARKKKLGKQEMIDLLNAWKKPSANVSLTGMGTRTPWATDATYNTVRNWFEQHIPRSRIPGQRYYKTTAGPGAGDIYQMVGSGPGTFRLRMKELKTSISRIEELLAPDLNVQKFLDDPLSPQMTPTLYTKMLEHRIALLDEMIGDRRAGRELVGELQIDAASAGEQASRKIAQNAALEGRVFGPVSAEDVNPNVTKKFNEARSATQAWEAADKAVRDTEQAISALKDEIAPLANKKKTKAGLTKKEQSKLDGLYKKKRIAEGKLKADKGARSKLKKPTAQQLEVGNIPEERMLAEARKVVNTYNRRVASPLYTKALDDQEMIKVLDALAGFDLSQFTRGFKMADGNYASFADGKTIIFTKDEWESLYQITENLPARRAELLRDISGFESNIQQQVARRSEVQAAIDEIESNLQRLRNGSSTRDLRRAINDTKDAIDGYTQELKSIDDEIRYLKEMSDDLTDRLKITDPATQQAALEKLRVLINDTVDGPSVLGGENLQKFLKFEHPAISDLKTNRAIANEQTQWEALGVRRQQLVDQVEPYRERWRAVNKERADMEQRFAAGTARAGELESIEQLSREIAQQVEPIVLEIEKVDRELAQLQAARSSAEAANLDTGIGTTPNAHRINVGDAKAARDEIEPLLKRNITPKHLAERQRRVRVNWEASDEFKILTEVNELEKNLFVSMHRFNTQAADGMIAERDRLLALVQHHTDAYNTAHPLEDIQAMIGTSGTIAQGVREADAILMENTGRFVAAEGDKAVEAIDTAGKRIATLQEERAKLLANTSGKNYKTGTQGKIDEIDRQIAGLQDDITNLAPKIQKRMDVAPPRTRAEVAEYVEEIRRLAQVRGPMFEEIPGVRGAKVEAAANNLVDQVETAGRTQQVVKGLEERRKEWGASVAERRKNVMDMAQQKNARLETAKGIADALRSKDESVLAEMAMTLGMPAGSAELLPDLVRENFWKYLDDQRAIGAALQRQLDEANALIDILPEQETITMLRRVAGGRSSVENTQEALQRIKAWVNDNRPVFEALSAEPDNPVYRAWASASIAENNFIMTNLKYSDTLDRLASAKNGEWVQRVVTPLADEWEDAARRTGLLEASERTLAAEGLPGLKGNKEALELLNNITRLRQPGVIDDLSQFMRGYTGFFRAYATLSPGFHVRNSISNIFSIFSAGADISNMRDGFRLWRILDRELANGGNIDTFLAAVPSAEREAARVSAEIMFGLAGGKVDNALEGFAREGGNKLRDNWMIRGSHKMGHKAEGSARFMLAYDSVVKGYEPGHAFNRTKRYMIDYNQKSILDESMRDIVPFWTWMSRNMPLQIVNRWANPKPYLIYNKFVNNFSQENKDGEVTPLSLIQQGAINLGGGKYLSPDLPFTRVDQQIQDLGDPRKYLGYINPGVKTPLEMLFNTNSFTGQPFKDEYVPIAGIFTPFIPLLQATGQMKYDDNGNPVMTKKAMYGLTGMIPPLGRAERLMPTGETGAGKVGNSFNSFIGLPVTMVNSNMQDAERFRRIAAMQKLVNQRKAVQEAE